jgi:hypothetical protein
MEWGKQLAEWGGKVDNGIPLLYVELTVLTLARLKNVWLEAHHAHFADTGVIE